MDKSAVRAVAAAMAMAVASGCVSTTLIKSQPPGAKVYLDGAYVGQTPYEMSDTKIVGSATHVKLRLDGFEESNVLISRNEQFSAGACLGGVLVLFPFLWIMGYNPEHAYEMTPLRYPPGYPQYPGYPPQGYPQQAYPPGYPYPPPQPYPQQPQAYPPPPPGATPVPPPAGGAPQPPPSPQGGAPAQMAPPPQPPPAPAPQAPPPAPSQNPAPSQAAPK